MMMPPPRPLVVVARREGDPIGGIELTVTLPERLSIAGLDDRCTREDTRNRRGPRCTERADPRPVLL